MNPTLQAALEYAARGWYVGLCHPRRKQSFYGYFDHTRDPDLIKRWLAENPTVNINVSTGTISNLMSVDIDGPSGLAFWEDRFGPCRGPKIITPRGVHLLFTCPCPTPYLNLHPEIDLCADECQTMMPPSVHPNGILYRWEDQDLPLGPIPI